MTIQRAVFLFSVALLFSIPVFAQGRGNASQPTMLISIRGRVVDVETGGPVLDARISLIAIGGTAMGQGQTSMGSDFTFDNLPTSAIYELKVEAEGYQTLQQPFQPSMSMSGYLTIPIRRTKFVEVPAKGKTVSNRLLQLPAAARDAFQNGMTQLYEKHSAEKSLPFFEKTLQLAPTFYEAQFQMGVAYQDLKRTPEAEAAFRDAAKSSDGKFAPPQFSLASLLSERQNFAEAETLALKGLESEPKSASGHYELARALLGQGKADQAESEARTSLDLSKDLPQNYLLLAAVTANRGQPADAVKNLDLYLAAVPTGPISDSVRGFREKLREQAGMAKADTAAPGGSAKPY